MAKDKQEAQQAPRASQEQQAPDGTLALEAEMTTGASEGGVEPGDPRQVDYVHVLAASGNETTIRLDRIETVEWLRSRGACIVVMMSGRTVEILQSWARKAHEAITAELSGRSLLVKEREGSDVEPRPDQPQRPADRPAFGPDFPGHGGLAVGVGAVGLGSPSRPGSPSAGGAAGH